MMVYLRARLATAALLLSALLLQFACSSGDMAEDDEAVVVTPDACAALVGRSLDGASVAAADFISTGSVDIENPGPSMPSLLDGLPQFCRVRLVITPVPGSRIGIEAWLPATGWSGRLLLVGNGGYSSAIAYHALADGIRGGYGMLATDTGHEGDDPEFARGNPERIVDWAWRAVHEAATKGSTLVEEMYGQPADYRYFVGCSTGGHQALMAAQRFADDFDGIIAGAPGHNRTHLNAGFLWQFVKNHRREPPHAEILPAGKLQLLNDAVLAQCRGQNGGPGGGLADDPWLNDPFACDFDPGILLCTGTSDSYCLTASEVDAVRALYEGPTNPQTGERIYFGQLPGSEVAGGSPDLPGWSVYWADPESPDAPARTAFWKYWALQTEDWNWWAFDFDADIRTTDERLAATVNAMDPDLSEFRDSGGKLLHYHGLSDAVVPATDSVDYFERARRALSGDVSDFYRLYLAPGVHHCTGGPGADRFDMLDALVSWVEDGVPPDRVIATRYSSPQADAEVEFQRPLCPYPQRAVYDGTGDPRSADSFACRNAESQLDVPQLGETYRR